MASRDAAEVVKGQHFIYFLEGGFDIDFWMNCRNSNIISDCDVVLLC